MDVRTRLEALLRKVLSGPEAFDMSEDLIELGLDSMGAVDLLLGLEREFGVLFPDELVTADTFASGDTLLSVLQDLGAA